MHVKTPGLRKWIKPPWNLEPKNARVYFLRHQRSLRHFVERLASVAKIRNFWQSSLKLAEIADVALIVTSRQGIHQPSCSNIRSEGNRRDHPQRDISLNKTEKTRKLKDLLISENGTQRSSNQDEIIALLKRIQVSISRGQSTSSRRTNRNISRQKKPAKSLLGTFRRHPRKKQTKAQSLEEIKGSPQSSNTLKDVSSRGSGSSGPLSRFVRKSPTTQLSSKENAKKAVEEKASETDAVSELQNLEGMKLIELKQLAKAKGVKGFSKLKKQELLELLKEVRKSSS